MILDVLANLGSRPILLVSLNLVPQHGGVQVGLSNLLQLRDLSLGTLLLLGDSMVLVPGLWSCPLVLSIWGGTLVLLGRGRLWLREVRVEVVSLKIIDLLSAHVVLSLLSELKQIGVVALD